MRSKIFFDTNILIYMQSGLDAAKTDISRSLFEQSSSDSLVVLSSQILQEFYITMTKKLGHDPITVKKLLLLFSDFEIVSNHTSIIFDAIDISVLHQVSFWDALVISAAISGNCKTLYSADLNHGQIIRGVQIINPFK